MKKSIVANQAKRRLLGLLLILMMLVNFIPSFGMYQAQGIDTEDSVKAKNAYINNSSTPQNGSSTNPVSVDLGDRIRYTISATNEKEPGTSTAQYDFLFVLDWSSSMDADINSSKDSARSFERNATLDMCDYVLANYPSSRVAIMTTNSPSTYPYTNNPHYTNIQFQTDFMDDVQYAEQRAFIIDALHTTPAYENSDAGTSLDAAIDKMAGLSTSYGGLETDGPKLVIPRIGDNLEQRLPVIAVLSDFQMTEEINDLANQSGQRYWSEVMKDRADRFDSLFPEGILHMVRLDHVDNLDYSSVVFDTFMTDYVVTASRTHWGFTTVSYDTSHTTALTSIINGFAGMTTYTKEQGTIITDVVPAGLEVDTNSISHGGDYDLASHIITWDLSTEHKGEITVEFTATVQQGSGSFINKAAIAYSNGIKGESNATYHETQVLESSLSQRAASSPRASGVPIKNAYINGSKVAQNGTSQNPMLVDLGDKIQYTLSVSNEKKVSLSGAKYDILFVLDWSNSMGGGMVSGQSGRDYMRDVVLDMSDFIMENYPNSRVALLAMNADPGITNNPNHIFIQYQTDFLTAAQYAAEKPAIVDSFKASPKNGTEDLVSFFKAANDKMEGKTVNYGSSSSGGIKATIPRKGNDLAERTPVIMFISDFQIPKNHASGNYWPNYMKGQSDRFAKSYPNGILQTVRFDHYGNTFTGNKEYSSSEYDNLMRKHVSPAGRSHWGFTRVPYETTYNKALSSIKDEFIALAPPPDILGTIITDMVPSGLVVDINSISHGGEYNSAFRTITWDLSAKEELEVTVSFVATVPQGLAAVPGSISFENQAYAAYFDGSMGVSNTTYHKLMTDTSLIFLKVDEKNKPMQGVKFLLYSCTNKDPKTHNHPWLATNDSSSCWGDVKTVFSKTDGLVEFSGLSAGSYMLVEVETQQGYQLPQGQWLIKIDDSFAIDIVAHGLNSVTLPPAFKLDPSKGGLLLPNYRQMEVPLTSGPGLMTLTVLGIVLLADGIIYAILPGRKERRLRKAVTATTTESR